MVYSDQAKMLSKMKKQLLIGEDEEEDMREAVRMQSQGEDAPKGSVLFEGYRALGYYSSSIPFSVVKSDQDLLIASAVGEHAFYVYDTAKLNLAYMSRHIADQISWIEATQDGFVYTAQQSQQEGAKCHIICWKKHRQMMVFEGHETPIVRFIVGGD
mmetsp:Transcript_16459/g.27937  ORF Transcript_16459/g.27937 Transcript_16459/m.27937 type:complete len:157 (+) Transcript_16459:109-579(+)